MLFGIYDIVFAQTLSLYTSHQYTHSPLIDGSSSSSLLDWEMSKIENTMERALHKILGRLPVVRSILESYHQDL